MVWSMVKSFTGGGEGHTSQTACFISNITRSKLIVDWAALLPHSRKVGGSLLSP